MDSEISKIWEEALRYASPLPIPSTATPTCGYTLTETNNNNDVPAVDSDDTNDNNTISTVNIDVTSKTAETERFTNIETLLTHGLRACVETNVNFSTDDLHEQTCVGTGPLQSANTNIIQRAMTNATEIATANAIENASTSIVQIVTTNDNQSVELTRGDNHRGNSPFENQAAVEAMIKLLSNPNSPKIAGLSGHTENINTSSHETQSSLRSTNTLLSLPNLPRASGSSSKDSFLELPNLSMETNVSDALAAGLKMIQQGNELIARALQLSKTSTTSTSADSAGDSIYTNLEPLSLSMPSSVESINMQNDTTSMETEIGETKNQHDSSLLQFAGSPKPMPNDTYRLIVAEQPTGFDSDNSSRDTTTTSMEPKPKRRRRREKNTDPTPSVPVLPPCKICDDKSSGFHYGANTCEACKGFFRRTLKKEEVIFQCKCSESEKLAWQRGPYKNGCPACRYERCLKVGMSKSAIKIGRYTLNRKTDNIREVKSLEAMDTVIEKAILSSMNANSSPSSVVDSPGFGCMLSSPEGVTVRDASPMTDLSCLTDSPSCSTSTDNVATPNPKPPVLTEAEIEETVKELTEAHKLKSLLNQEIMDRPKDVVDQLHRKYLESYNLKESVFGHMQPLSKAEYKEFYNATGIDIDGRQAALQEALNHFTQKIGQVVEYAKSIPGFNDLCSKDQASLIKYSRPEHVVVAGYRGMLKNLNVELQVCTTPWGKEVHLKDIGRFIPRDLQIMRYELGKLLEDLDLSIEEEAILRAIVITSPDRCELEDPSAVQEIQYKLMACLEYLFKKLNKDSKRLYKTFNLLVKFREFSEREFKEMKELMFDWPLISNYRHSILKDLFI